MALSRSIAARALSIAIGACVVLLLVARPAHAQLDGGAPDAHDAVDASADGADGAAPGDPELRRQRAADAFGRGTDAYHRGDFARAAALFREAYAALPDPAPLYNLARSLESDHQIHAAVDAFERYLDEAPHAADRFEVLEHVNSLRNEQGQVFIASDPAGAQVFLDDNPHPESTLTPVVLTLRPGQHVIVLDRPGHQHVTRRFAVDYGGSSTFYLRLPPDPGSLPGGGVRGRVDSRILARRSTVLFSPRFSFLFGGARPWNDPRTAINVTLGGEASVFVGRSLSAKLHFERVEPSGAWTIVTADFGYVIPIEDLDIGAYAVAGTAYGWINQAAQESGAPGGPQILAGGELRVDWVFHRHLAIGAFFRAAWRNLLVGGSPQSLNSFGLSVSLFL